jgi:hypothetical protein
VNISVVNYTCTVLCMFKFNLLTVVLFLFIQNAHTICTGININYKVIQLQQFIQLHHRIDDAERHNHGQLQSTVCPRLLCKMSNFFSDRNRISSLQRLLNDGRRSFFCERDSNVHVPNPLRLIMSAL